MIINFTYLHMIKNHVTQNFSINKIYNDKMQVL